MSDALAERFHEIYESCAHDHGYETRKASAVPWNDVPQKNKALMIYVCGIIEKEFINPLCQERDSLMKVCEDETGAIKKLTEERDRLRKTLEFYSDDDNYAWQTLNHKEV